MRRGVKPRFTIARSEAWLSPSSAIRLRAVVNSKGLSRVRTASATAKRRRPQESGGKPSSPPFISIVNMARDEKVSGSFSTAITSS